MRDYYWLGRTDEGNEGVWRWITGESFSYSNWNEGEPNNGLGAEHCLELYEGPGWNDVRTTELCRGFICEVEPENYTPAATLSNSGNLYELYTNAMSWKDAELFARGKGGHLVTIDVPQRMRQYQI